MNEEEFERMSTDIVNICYNNNSCLSCIFFNNCLLFVCPKGIKILSAKRNDLALNLADLEVKSGIAIKYLKEYRTSCYNICKFSSTDCFNCPAHNLVLSSRTFPGYKLTFTHTSEITYHLLFSNSYKVKKREVCTLYKN